MGRLILLVLCAGAAGGWILSAPAQQPAAPPPPSADLLLVDSAASAARTEAVAEGEGLELERQPDGHFYAEVRVNNVPVRFLVDTGASGIALTRDDARRAGLAVSAGMYDVVGQGASGEVRGEHVMLDRVELGRAKVERTHAVILDSGHHSLLGQSFLREFTVEIAGDRMRLR